MASPPSITEQPVAAAAAIASAAAPVSATEGSVPESAQENTQEIHETHETHHHHHHHNRSRERRPSTIPHSNDAYMRSAEEVVPPPPFNSTAYGQMDLDQNGFETKARVDDDGRVNIKINQRDRKLSNIFLPALRHQLELHKIRTDKSTALPVPPSLGGDQLPVPPMNIVIQIVGSRGDVQPYVALGQELKNKYGHRVRLATHPTFRDFVTENGLEFFSIGGDPAELMAFMVKNPGLMPGIDSLKAGDIGKRRKGIYEMITGCWRSCIETGDGTGIEASDDLLEAGGFEYNMGSNSKPFVADAIIANPPSFAHVHIAEKLGIPLHMTFTMPWSPTQSFPHPLANIVSTNAESAMTNFVTYALVDMMTWQGLGDVINRFREKSLGLEPLSIMWAPGMASRLKISYTYCWSPALIPKPKDWGSHIDISGFYFLDLASNYVPDPSLQAFLDAGPPPVYIGFGSIVVDDPNAMTKLIFDAVRITGQRALVSKGWGGFGADQIGIPEGVYMLGNCPHDWLFTRVSCVVHHGGAGTTAAGIRAGRPTVVVPFFGDQPFWGSMVARAGAGPHPVPYKQLTAEKLAESILQAIKPESLERAAELSAQIANESGTKKGAEQFHSHIHVNSLRCSLDPTRVAVWRVKRTDIRLSAFAATVLGNEGLIEFGDLKLYRSKEYATEEGPWDPISGGASALIGTLGNLSMGVADFPVEILRSLKLASAEIKERSHSSDISRTSTNTTSPPTTSDGPPLSATNTMTQSDTEQHKSSGTSSPHRASTEQTSFGSPGAQSPSRISMSHSHRHIFGQHSRSNSRSSSQTRHNDSVGEGAGQWTLESMIGAGKGVSRIVGVGLKSPMDFTMGLAQGFHNAPKLYGDDTVRQSEKITGFQSGLKAAGKEFTYGFYDGITGLATQPIRGAEKEGAAGLLKGFAKGIGGLILKPGAGIWGIPGYTAKGIYAELQKLFGSSVQNYIIAARTAQGYEEWKESTPEQRANIITVWKSGQVELRKHGKKYGKEKTEAFEKEMSQEELPHGFYQTRHLSFDERKKLAEERDRRKKDGKTPKESSHRSKHRCKFCPFRHGDDVHHIFTFRGIQNQDHKDVDIETAIQKSVDATSKGNPEEDRMIARALRASVAELQTAQQTGDHDAAYERAIAASIAEANRVRAESGVPPPTAGNDGAADHDEELAKALKESLLLHKQETEETVKEPAHFVPHHLDHQPDLPGDSSDSGYDTEDDEDYKRAIEISKLQHTGDPHHDEHDENLVRATTESKEAPKPVTRQKTEEEIIMDYIKKQSLLENEIKRNGGGSSK